MVAQADEKTGDDDEIGDSWGFRGGYGERVEWSLAAAIVTVAVSSGGHGGSHGPVCP